VGGFTPVSGFVGGLLIGLAVVLMLLAPTGFWGVRDADERSRFSFL
jgi:multisubunit Na+/H+ antiporter MnhB subunit